MTRSTLTLLLMILLSFQLTSACSSDGGSEADALNTDAIGDTVSNTDGTDLAPQDDSTIPDLRDEEGSLDSTTPPVCSLPLLLNETFEPAPTLAEGDTQIHAAACFDGDAIWMVYNQKDTGGGNGFDVFATRIGCDASTLVSPFKVNVLADANETEPELACSGNTVAFAWQSDNGLSPDNLDIFYRTYQVDGTPIMEQDAVLEVTVGGILQTRNAWMTKVAPLPDDRFAIVGAMVVDDSFFQTVVQKVASDGSLEGEGIVVSPEPTMGQVFPSISATEDGTLYAAWVDSPAEEDDFIRQSRLLPNQNSFEPVPGFQVAGTNSGGAPMYSNNLPGTTQPFLAFHSEGAGQASVLLYEGDQFDSTAQHLTLGSDTAFDHTPAVAATPAGGAIIWYRILSGFKNDVYFGTFRWLGDSLSVPGAPVRLNEAGAPPYSPVIVPLSEEIFFVAWMEGVSPNFRIKARFVQP